MAHASSRGVFCKRTEVEQSLYNTLLEGEEGKQIAMAEQARNHLNRRTCITVKSSSSDR